MRLQLPYARFTPPIGFTLLDLLDTSFFEEF